MTKGDNNEDDEKGLWIFGYLCSDFVTNSYGKSWDSSCEKSWVPVQNQCVSVQKNESKIEIAWVFTFVWNSLVQFTEIKI